MAEFEQDGQPEAALPIGERLRLAREAKGLSLDEVASRTRIPIRHLLHIERGEWDALPAVTYSVGFARSYANAVGLDGAEIGRELRDQIGGARAPVSMPEYYEPADPARVPPRWLAIAAVLIGVVLIAGYMLWRGGLDEGAGQGAATEVPVAEAPPQPQAPPPPPQPANLSGQPVALVAGEEVWLHVGDGAGPAIFQGVLQAGQRFDVPAGARDPRLRTGRPQALRIEIGGRDFGPVEPVERIVSGVSLRAEDLAQRAQDRAAPAPAPAPAQPR